MEEDTHNRFFELRESYYIAGRNNLINRLFQASGISFGYSIELSIKFLLISNGYTGKRLHSHDLELLYKTVTEEFQYIKPLSVSGDFLQFTNER